MKYKFKIWLIKKGLTTCPDDYTGIAESIATLDLYQITDQLMKQNPEYRRELITGASYSCIKKW